VTFSFSDRVEVPKYVLENYLENELVLLNLQAEFYYGLDEIGTRMWKVLTTASSIDDAYVQLLTEFDVEPELLRLDLSRLLRQLFGKGLIRIQATPSASLR
jgi:Coenzyme PQQ synthesis protein D (PqqD)